MEADTTKPVAGILMGSRSDWEIMQHCAAQLKALSVPWEAQAISAHRAPDTLFEYLSTALERGLEVIIAAAYLFSTYWTGMRNLMYANG